MFGQEKAAGHLYVSRFSLKLITFNRNEQPHHSEKSCSRLSFFASSKALMICPDLFPSNFISFLEVYNMLQDGVLVDNHLDEYIQVAPFHPLFEFEGSAENIDNFTNRSPYPIFHILREEEVSVAVDALQGDSERVWKRNVELLEELEDQLGREKTTQVLSGVETDLTTREKVKEVVKKLKNVRLPEI